MKQKYLRPCLALVCGISVASFACAQDVPAEPVVDGPVQVEMAVVDGDGLEAPMIFSTTTNGDGPGQFRVMSGNVMSAEGLPGMTFASPGMDPFSLLGDVSVQKDLELVDDQLTQLRELQTDFGRQMKEQIGDLSKGGVNSDRFKGLGELAKRLRDEQQSQMQNLLLPHQIDRLKQVALQRQMDSAGTAGALASEKLAEELGITDEQKARLLSREKEIKTELTEKISKMQEDARQQLLQELTTEQREKLKQMIGEKFKSVPKDWNDNIQRRIQMRQKSESSNDKKAGGA